MRKFAALGLLLAAALFVTAGLVEAGNPAPGADLYVHYEGAGTEGVLSLGAHPGSGYMVYNSAGVPVAGGAMPSRHTSFPVCNCGPSPDGTILIVEVNGEIVAVIDPDWDWD